MPSESKNILVFKTNLQTDEQLQSVSLFLNQTAEIERWSIDTEDIDCVLRIVSATNNAPEIIGAIHLMGYECAELE